jgi:hypothetical protein
MEPVSGILTALAILNASLATAQSLGKILSEAQQAGRDVTPEEIASATADRKAALADLDAAIEQRKTAGQ